MGPLDSAAIKTYRYLRLGMVVLVAVLLTSVLFEWWDVGRSCWQTSVSAYYYTPVQPVLVGVLVAIGVALITVKGSTHFEDIVLNLAGMLAPVVAFVPTSGRGSCRSADVITGSVTPLIDNSVPALAVGGVISLLVAFVVARWTGHAALGGLDPMSWVGLGVAATILAGGVVWYLFLPGFDRGAHGAAAVLLFVGIGIVAFANARAASGWYRTAYSIVTVGIVGAAVVFLLAGWAFDWDHAVLWVEATEIVLFALFWIVQTAEFWERGVRTP